MVSISRKIYLAGKITAWSKNGEDWRCSIIPNLDTSACDAQWLGAYVSQPCQWHMLTNAIFGKFHYVGPFFTNMQDAAGGHGGGLTEYPHAINPSDSHQWHHGGDTSAIRQMIPDLCLRAIASADLVFAWIDTPDCYGTLFELGYAKALGKHIAAYFVREPLLGTDTSRPWPWGEELPDPLFELWFTYFSCRGRLATGTPADALRDAIAALGWDTTYESPLEEAFATAWAMASLHLTYPLISQYPIKDGRYRLDFAYPHYKVGIELDGYTYHSDRDAFTRDRQRQREIEADGWRIIRFSGDEIRTDVSRCVQETAHFLSIQQYRKQQREED